MKTPKAISLDWAGIKGLMQRSVLVCPLVAEGGTAPQRCTPNPKPAVNFQSNLLSVSLYITNKEFENGRICGRHAAQQRRFIKV